MAHNEQKRDIRARMKALCRIVNSQRRTVCAMRAQKFLSAQQYYIEAAVVFSTSALPSEADTTPINNCILRDGKALGLPKMRAKPGEMDFILLDSGKPLKTQLAKNSLGIDEPQQGKAFSARDFFYHGSAFEKKLLVIVPALAFTPDGRRLGRGKGYYDRALFHLKRECAEHGWKVTLAGYGFDFQVIADVPTEEHDMSVDYIFY
jgi:5-formyltetrahydrofolate cyclo-ligase